MCKIFRGIFTNKHRIQNVKECNMYDIYLRILSSNKNQESIVYTVATEKEARAMVYSLNRTIDTAKEIYEYQERLEK